jgi:hypothetical protein
MFIPFTSVGHVYFVHICRTSLFRSHLQDMFIPFTSAGHVYSIHICRVCLFHSHLQDMFIPFTSAGHVYSIHICRTCLFHSHLQDTFAEDTYFLSLRSRCSENEFLKRIYASFTAPIGPPYFTNGVRMVRGIWSVSKQYC